MEPKIEIYVSKSYCSVIVRKSFGLKKIGTKMGRK